MSMKEKFKKFKNKLIADKNNEINFFDEQLLPNDIEEFGLDKNYKKNNLKEMKKNNKTSKNSLFVNFRRRNSLQIIKYLETNKIFNCFFYTNVNNISLILEQGIRPISSIKLLSNEEYIVWTYLEHKEFLELELSNSTRHYFWKWCAENKVDLNKIAIISIDINKLFKYTTKDWTLDLQTNRIQIYEIVPVDAIDWILVKDKKMFSMIKIFIDQQNLKIKLFQGNNGQINN